MEPTQELGAPSVGVLRVPHRGYTPPTIRQVNTSGSDSSRQSLRRVRTWRMSSYGSNESPIVTNTVPRKFVAVQGAETKRR